MWGRFLWHFRRVFQLLAISVIRILHYTVIKAVKCIITVITTAAVF